MPDFQPVYGSSTVTEIAYHEGSRDLFVRFKNGDTYKYKNVPPEEWESFLHSDSKGKYVNRVLRRAYQYERSQIVQEKESGDGKS